MRHARQIGSESRNIPFTKELRMDMARVEIPVSGWTCLRTEDGKKQVRHAARQTGKKHPKQIGKLTLVNVGRVGLLAGLAALLLLASGSGGLLASLLLLSRGLAANGSLAGGGGLLLSSLGGSHC